MQPPAPLPPPARADHRSRYQGEPRGGGWAGTAAHAGEHWLCFPSISSRRYASMGGHQHAPGQARGCSALPPRPRPPPCCFGRCWPRVRSPCARSTAEKLTDPFPLTPRPDQSNHHPGRDKPSALFPPLSRRHPASAACRRSGRTPPRSRSAPCQSGERPCALPCTRDEMQDRWGYGPFVQAKDTNRRGGHRGFHR